MTAMEGQSKAQVDQFELSSSLNQRIVDAILQKQCNQASNRQVQVSSIESFRKYFTISKDKQSIPTYNSTKCLQNTSQQKQPSTQYLSNTLQSQKILKEYFQSYFTAIFNKMQEMTNQKLQAVINRLNNISNHLNQQRRTTLQAALSRQEKPTSRYQRKGTYIKNREKLDYIDKIEKGKSTIQQVALALNINQKIVRSWLANKQFFRQKQLKKNGNDQDIML